MYKWGILGLQPPYQPSTNFLGHPSTTAAIRQRNKIPGPTRVDQENPPQHDRLENPP